MAQQPIGSRMSVAGHPIHPTLVHFPVAALVGLMAVDLAFIFTHDHFWARVGVWLAGVGSWGGWLAGLVGLIDLVIVPRIRRLITGWIHAILAVMMLSLATFNWMLRLGDPALYLLPWGVYISFMTGALILLTSMLGGQLVYEHGIGVGVHSES